MFDDEIAGAVKAAVGKNQVFDIIYELSRSLGRVLFGDERAMHASIRRLYRQDDFFEAKVTHRGHRWTAFVFRGRKDGIEFCLVRGGHFEGEWLSCTPDTLESELRHALSSEAAKEEFLYASQLSR